MKCWYIIAFAPLYHVDDVMGRSLLSSCLSCLGIWSHLCPLDWWTRSLWCSKDRSSRWCGFATASGNMDPWMMRIRGGSDVVFDTWCPGWNELGAVPPLRPKLRLLRWAKLVAVREAKQTCLWLAMSFHVALLGWGAYVQRGSAKDRGQSPTLSGSCDACTFRRLRSWAWAFQVPAVLYWPLLVWCSVSEVL